MATRDSFVLFASFVFCFNAVVVSSLTHDQKVDMITEAYTSLKFVVQSLIDVQTEIQGAAITAEDDILTLDDSKARSEYEVNVMKVDHQMMLAELAKRQEVVTPEEQQSADDRGKAIDEAQAKVEELKQGIADAKTKVNDLNQEMTRTTLSAADLKALQDKANKESDNPDDHITLPDPADIKRRAGEQLTNMQTVIDTVVDDVAKNEAQELKNTIATKLNSALDGQSNFAVLTVQCKEIDVALLQFRNLNIYGSAARMEL
ncbi:Hypothetical predicted protein [Paramuricea clavata]|uniref:Uncharacterized protein n=2 Tax=Paramuricea clavata TaxID=317549 RepID=A0A6S7G6B7_PARCT|nr:Hypothetical predicted protein [Paramuricea clavata]